VQELFELVQAELRRSGYEELLSSGLVLSGGSARLAGLCELGEDVFHLPVRVGTPFYQGPLADVVCQPQYATVMGLIMEGAAQRRRGLMARETRNVRHTFERIKAWFEKNF
jgi:cell division protein FtsA